MSGYIETAGSWSVTDEGHYHNAQNNYAGDKVTAVLYITAGTSDTCNYSVVMSHNGDYNYFRLYLNIAGTDYINQYYNNSSSKVNYATKTGTAKISGDTVSITLGVSTSKDSTSATYMTFTSGELTRNKWTHGTAPTISVVDNGNNTATLSGTQGISGNNNSLIWSSYYYTTNGHTPSDGAWHTTTVPLALSEGAAFSKIFTITSDTTITAHAWSGFPHGNLFSGEARTLVKYYAAPSDPGKPVIEYTKSRLTIKEPWTISWDAATAGNTNTPIAGYRLRIYKNGIPIDIKNSSGTVVSATVGADKYYDMNETSYVINPISHGILPGDNIRIELFAYAFNGAGTRLWSGNEERAVLSDVYTVQNAGVMHPLVDGQYVEGVVWACIPDSTSASRIKWVEADIVKTCISKDNWVEAE